MIGKLFSFSGRAGRLEYLGVGGLQFIILAFGFATLLGMKAQGGAALMVLALVLVPFMWVGWAVTVRRIRDMGWPIFLTILGVLFLPFFGLLLFVWPGKPGGEWDEKAAVFSDDPDRTPRKSKTKVKPEADQPDWMQRALAQVSAPKQPTAQSYAPKPRISGAMAAASGPRTEFGLRR